jgi:alpha-beta hydrolase superfamily lysophospholipase
MFVRVFMSSSWTSFCCRWSVLPICGVLCAVYLSGCGGSPTSGGSPTAVVVPEPTPINAVGPGQFKQAVQLKMISTGEIASAIELAGTAAFRATPKYAVQTYRMTYLTQDAAGREILASALIAVPVKSASSLSPVLSYQHGTITQQAEAPSNLPSLASPEVVLASQGYIVQSADYVGYGESKTAVHPYLLAAPSAAAVIDLLTAAKYWRQTQRVLDNKQLFLTGYSEGAYVSMAIQKALQAGASVHRADVVSVVAGGGPYNVARTLDEALKQVRQASPLLGSLLNPGVLKFLSEVDRRNVRDQLLAQLLGGNSEASFSPTFIDYYLADNRAALEAASNVDDWQPTVPVNLFHGVDDRTVSYIVSSGTLQAMQSKGAANLVTLTNCTAVPAGHNECVQPFWRFMLDSLGKMARDL